jgi:hypothetical protein
MVELDAEAKTKRYFQTAGCQSGGLNGKYRLCAIRLLGGDLSVTWVSLTNE